MSKKSILSHLKMKIPTNNVRKEMTYVQVWIIKEYLKLVNCAN